LIGKDEKLKRALAWVPAKLYELGVRLRVAAYETEYLKPKRLNAKVISIGNITLGGSGKTPMVAYIARYLKSEDQEVAILTRGYGRDSSGMRVLNKTQANPALQSASYREYGDEPLMLARALPGVPVVINEDRYEGGRLAESELGASVLVLDDAYQHLALARDLNILLIDATDPFGGFEMVPFGRLREPLYAVKRADAVIVTRADKPFDQARTGAIIKYFCGDRVPVMYVYSVIARLRHLDTGEVYEAREFTGWNAVVMCGIGNPEAFSDDLTNIGVNILDECFFADHHAYSRQDLDAVIKKARDAGADFIVTTEKDAVRLEGLGQSDLPVYAAELEIESEDEVRLKSLLLRTMIRDQGPGVRGQGGE
jgi:tetraacyldisaccharide 4'-kinase